VRQRDSLLEAMVAFRSISKRITVSEIIAFLYTCENEGLSVQEFAYIAGFSQSAASRNLRALGRPDIPWSLDPALGLVEPFLSPHDGRSHVLHLSEKGLRLRERLDEIIGQAVPIRPQPNFELRDLGTS
jgi:DNA-binding MarR family transcriptional regulator